MNALTVNGKQLTIDGVEILGYEETTVGYSAFKLLMRGVGPHNISYPSNYVQWSEIGMSWQGNVERIGPSYFTLDSTALSGTPWGNGNPDKLFDGSIVGADNDKFDAYNFTAAEVIFHTNSAIVPSAYHFWSCKDGQWETNRPGYAAPNTFTFYGKNENTQQYEELITVSASQLDLHNNAKTTILAE